MFDGPKGWSLIAREISCGGVLCSVQCAVRSVGGSDGWILAKEVRIVESGAMRECVLHKGSERNYITKAVYEKC